MPDFGDIAQVAITLAGFTGLVGVLRSRRKEGLSHVQAMHIANLLMTSTFVVLLSFVPQWIGHLPFSSQTHWLWCTRILLAMHVLAFAIVLPFALREKALFRTFPKLDQLAVYITGSLGVSLVVVEAFVSTGRGLEYAPFLFQGVLLFFICLAFIDFLVLLLRE